MNIRELDRSQAPAMQMLENISFKAAEPTILPNGIELYLIEQGEKEVSRIDFLFSSGKWDQLSPLTATFANMLLKEGTNTYSSSEIAEKLDYFGAWIQPSVTQHNSYLTVYSLNKHFSSVIPIIESMLKEPLFPENEFNIFRNRQKEQYMVELQKVQILALHASLGQIYGESHPYGAHANIDTFNNLNLDLVRDYYRRCYRAANCKIIVTGRPTQNIVEEISSRFGSSIWQHQSEGFAPKEALINPSNDRSIFIDKSDSQQAAIRIASTAVNRNHEDYNGFRVLNTIFGGYFGSRLMENIREEKGYTYGIGSAVSANRYGAHFVINTQTGNEYVNAVIQETFNEMQKLRDEKVSEQELNTVKCYLMGEMARMFDGPFATADAQVSLMANNLDSDYYQRQIDTIRAITSDDIQELANRYLKEELFYIAAAGKR
ncbi:MAG: M16 family metallopeptidase [Bacteroidales bacterium]